MVIEMKRVKKWVGYIYAAIFPALLFLALELLNPASRNGLFATVGGSVPIVLLSALFLFLLFALWFALCGNLLAAGLLTSVFWLIIYVVNFFKMRIAGGVFVPTDLLLTKKLHTILGFSSITFDKDILFPLLLFVLMHIPLYFISKKIKVDLRTRMVSFSAILAFTLFVFASKFSLAYVMPAFHVSDGTKVSSMQSYKEKGVLLGFYMAAAGTDSVRTGLKELSPQKPIEIGTEQDTKVSKGFERNVLGLTEGEKPNVIVIMSEAFFDPTVLPNIRYSEDPVPNLHRLASESKSATIMPAVFGGGTCNTEFEFLSGSAIYFCGSALSFPYEQREQYFTRNIDTALPWLYKKNGYSTIAMHPYEGSFFNREDNLPLLGFDDYISIEDMSGAVIKGEFVSDEYFMDQMIVQIDHATKPLFLFGISMQNHWGYDAAKYESYDIVAASDLLSEPELRKVDSYVQGVHDADKQLGRLIDYIDQSGKPTMVVFFGDHLPILGEHTDAIFEKLSYVTSQQVYDWTFEDKQKMYQTPYLAWSNYENNSTDWGIMSPYFLGTLVARDTGIQLNGYYAAMLRNYQQFHGLTENLYVDNKNLFHDLTGVNEMPHIMKYNALQQNNLFGEDEYHDFLRRLIESP